jgi:flagellar hook protein FlgE
MSVYSLFSTSTLAMMSYSDALATIGTNIANVSTGGFKRTDVRFSTVLGDTIDAQSDMGGVVPVASETVSQQGFVQSSDRDLDLAISGKGMFVVNSQFDGSGSTYYTRDGSFGISLGNDVTVTGNNNLPITVKEGYLVDKNGYFVQGWAPQPDGTFSNSGSLTSLRIDPFSFANQGQATTQASLDLNLPAGDAAGDTHNFIITLFDDLGNQQTATLDFTKATTLNQWDMTWTTTQTPVAQVDTVTLGGTVDATDVYGVTVDGTTVTYTVAGTEPDLDAIRDGLVAAINAHPTVGGLVTAAAGGAGTLTLTANTAGTGFTATASATDNGTAADNTAAIATTVANAPSVVTSAPVTLAFDNKGQLLSPASVTINAAWNGGGVNTAVLDIANFTQFAGPFLSYGYSQNGFGPSTIRSISFDSSGHVIANFENATDKLLYKLPLAVFTNADSLQVLNGNVYAESFASGPPQIAAAGAQGFAGLLPGAHELSNVDLAGEFTRMIIAQSAYNASATALKTMDEITETTAELKT